MQSAVPGAATGMPMPGIPVTPTRRTHNPGSGSTPLAKRVPERVAASPQMQQLSAEQVSAMVQGVKSQMDSDTMWLGKIVEALNEHGDALDMQHGSIKTMAGIQEGMGVFATDMQQKVAELSQRMLNDDELIRASVNDNDKNLKSEINSNDVDVRKVIAAQDAVTTNALQNLNAKIESAMNENIQIRGIVEGNANEWNKRVITVEQHCSVAAATIEEMKNNLMNNVKAVAGLAGRVSEIHTGMTHINNSVNNAAGAAAAATAAAATATKSNFGPGASGPADPFRSSDPWSKNGMPSPTGQWGKGAAGAYEAHTHTSAPKGAGMGPERFGLNGPSTNSGNGTNGRELRLYEEKVVMQSERRYSEKDANQWKIMTENYFIGRCPDMARFLAWIVEQADEEIDFDDISKLKMGNDIMVNIDVAEASQQLWAFLDINLTGDAVMPFRNVDRLNGAEAWRRTVMPIISNTACRRKELRNRADNPKPANKFNDFDQALNQWLTDYRLFREYGGEEFSQEKMREMLVNILPTDLATYVTLQSHSYKTFTGLKGFIKEHIQLLKDQASRGRPLNLVDQAQAPTYSSVASEDDLEQRSDRSAYDDCPQEVMMMIQNKADAGDQECLAIVNKWRFPKKTGLRTGAGGGAPGAGGGARQPRREPPPRDRRDIRCGNCGKLNHTSADCTEPKKALSLRECFNCGKPGHVIRDCPEKKKGNVNSITGGAESASKPAYALMFGEENGSHAKRVKEQRAANVAKHGPKQATLGDFVNTRYFQSAFAEEELTAEDAISDDESATRLDTEVSKEEWPLLADDARPSPKKNKKKKKSQGKGDKAKHNPKVVLENTVTKKEENKRMDSTGLHESGDSESVSELEKVHAVTTGGVMQEVVVAPALIDSNEVASSSDLRKMAMASTRSRRTKKQRRQKNKVIAAAPCNDIRCQGCDDKCDESDDSEDYSGMRDLVDSSDSEVDEEEEKSDEEQLEDIPMEEVKRQMSAGLPVLNEALKKAILAAAGDESQARFLASVIDQLDPQRSMSVNLFTADCDLEDAPLLISEDDQQWQEVEFEVALDSGSIVNVCHSDDAPGYILQESPGSKKGQNFVVGDGGKLPNQGEKHLNLAAPKDGGAISMVTSKFQIANVTRPLMSVGHICDQGLHVNFYALYAMVYDDKNQEVCRFNRSDSGLYICKMKLRSPFTRQDQ